MRRSESQRSIFSRRVPRLAATAVVAALAQPLAGCFLPNEIIPAAIPMPPAYRAGPRHADAALPSVVWWRGFGSKELTALIEEALTSNFDVAAAVARIVQADANSRVAGAALLPIVDLNGSAHAPARLAERRGGVAATASSRRRGPSASTYSTSLSASYEIDFWGKNRAAHARRRRACGRQPLRSRGGGAHAPSSASPTPISWCLRRNDRLRIARSNLAAATRVYNLIKQRFDVGTASALDTAQQESLVNTQRASIPPLEQTLAAEHGHARGADRPHAGVRDHSRRQHVALANSAGDARAALRSDRAAPGHPRGRGAARIRQCQCLFRARRDVFPASS